MTKTKSIEVYEEFEPWMIGETVEVGLYNKQDRKNAEPLTGSVYGRMGGVLKSYFTTGTPETGKSGMRLNGDASEREWSHATVEYLISVIEDRSA